MLLENVAAKKRIDKIIVVEGRADTANLKRFYDVDTYETGGSSIDATDLERLQILQDKQGLIVFTDPDFQGERIRKIIMAAIPEAQHVFLNRDEAVPKSKTKGRSLGVEHATFVDLEKALSTVSGGGSIVRGCLPNLMQQDLMTFGLILKSDSRQRREFLCSQLRIGYVNGKHLLKRLHMFGVERHEIEKVMNDYKY